MMFMKKIKLILVNLFILNSVFYAQISVYAKVDHIVPDGVDTQGGIALTVSGSTSPYTYTWNPGGIYTKDISNISAGQYTVNVKSASNQTVTAKYSIGYKVNWTSLNRCTFSNDSLKSTSSGVGFYSRAISKNTLQSNTDGWMEYILDVKPSKAGYVGFLDSVSPNTPSITDIDFGFCFVSNGAISASENGTLITLTTTPKVGDVLRLERVGNVINYKINNTTIRTTTVTGVSSKVFKLKAAISLGASLVNLGCSFNESGSASFPNYSFGYPLIKHLTNSTTNDGSIKYTPEVTGAYSYTWLPSNTNSNTISGLSSGQYQLKIMDNNISMNKYYNIGYKVNWTSLNRCTFSNDSLKSTTSSIGLFSSAVSKNTLQTNTDGWMEYVLDVLPNKQGYVGFLDSVSPNAGITSDIDFGFCLTSNGYIQSVENGTLTTLTSAPNVGDVLRLERVGNAINYKINNVILRTTTVAGTSSKIFKLKASISLGASLVNLGCSFLESGGGYFPNYSYGFPLIKHLSASGANDASIKYIPDVAGAYSYTWQSTGVNSNSLTGLNSGQYLLKLNNNNITMNKYFNIGYKVNWTDLNRCVFNNDTIKSNTNLGALYSRAVSKNTLQANTDGWIEYVLDAVPIKPGCFGLLDSISPNTSTYTDIDYGFYFFTNGSISVSEYGVNYSFTSAPKVGDVLRVERVGNVISYKLNDIIIRSSTIENISTKALKIKAALTVGLGLVNLGCSFTETGSGNFPNYINLNPTISHVSGSGFSDGKIIVSPAVPGNYTYNWTNSKTNSVQNLKVGVNKITVIDSLGSSSSYSYNVGYKTNWKDVSNGFFRNDTLKGTSSTVSTYVYAHSTNKLLNNTDGWFEYVVNSLPSYSNFIGFVDTTANSPNINTDIQYGLYYTSANSNLYSYERGTTTLISLGINIGDILRVERVGNSINYMINGVLRRSITSDSISNKAFNLKARLQYKNYLTNVSMNTTPCNSNLNAGVTSSITCTNTMVVLTSTTNISSPSYTWSPGGNAANSSSTSVTAAGTYTLKVSNTAGCTQATTVAVIANTVAPIVNAGQNQVLLSNAQPIILSGNSNASSGSLYSWSPGGSSPTTYSTSISSAGLYTLSVTDAVTGCTNSDTVMISSNFLNVVALKEHASIDNLSSGIVGISVNGGVKPYNFIWADVASNTNLRTQVSPGVYTVTVVDSLNDSLKVPVLVGLKNNWRTLKNISISNTDYKKQVDNADSMGVLVSHNYIPVDTAGGTELTVTNKLQTIVFGFLGFASTDLDLNYSVPYVSDEKLNSTFPYIDSIVNKRFANASGTPSNLSGKNYDGIHLVELSDGFVNIRFKGFSQSSAITYKEGDMFRLSRSGSGKIKLFQNNILIAEESGSFSSQHLLNAMFLKSNSASINSYGTLALTSNFSFASTPYQKCDEPNLNWVSSKTYDENGVVKSESKVYMDMLGRTLQTQSKLLSASNVIVSEPLYDGYGRQIGQTLPAPSFKSVICYVPNFVEISNNASYTHQYFDNPIGVPAPGEGIATDEFNALGDVNHPLPVYNGNAGKLGWYYSNNNTAEPLVAADSYPYSRVEYYNDPLGRPKRVSGVGEQHFMGSNHETKYIYTSTPAVTQPDVENELDFVFPHRTYELEKDFSVNISNVNNINRNLQLFKTIAINPDGKDQITYTNSSGKTIATCITGDGSGCVTHTDVKILQTANGTKNKELIYIPKLKAGTFKFYELVGNTKIYNSVIPQLKDALNNVVLNDGTDYTYNSTNGLITFLGNYTNRSLYLELTYLNNSSVPFTANSTINASVDVDYTQWTLYFYDRKGRLLANASPNDVVCQATPYSVQRTTQKGKRFTKQMLSPLNTSVAVPDSTTSMFNFKLNSEVARLGTSNLSAFFAYKIVADTIFNFNVDSTNFDLFTFNNTNYTDSTSTPLPTDSLSQAIGDTTFYNLDSYYDSLYVAASALIDTVPPAQYPLYSLLHSKISYKGYFTVHAKLPDGSFIKLNADSIPFDFGVEAVGVDSTTGGVACRAFGQAGSGDLAPEVYPLPDFPDAPPTSTLTMVPHGLLSSNINVDAFGNSTGGYSQSPGIGLLSSAITVNGSIYLEHNPTSPSNIPVPIPINLANKYMYDEYDRLIGSESQDEGRVDYVYDQLEDKLLFTQNDKQRANGGKFNCIVYDKLGRVSITGEYDPNNGGATSGGTNYYFQSYTDYYKTPQPVPAGRISVGTLALSNNTNAYNDGHMFERTFVEYDNSDISFPASNINIAGAAQKYTAGKVSKTYNDNLTTWYSYDELGRLVLSVDYSAEMGYNTNQNFYDFRGKLNLTSYNSNMLNKQLLQLFSYDADERLTSSKYALSFTSLLSTGGNQSSKYSYYLHGPLKRMELGNKLQGLDYVYTIGGMLKSINNPISNSTNLDPGLDGYATGPNANVSPDIFSMALQYYKDDYKRNNSPIKSYNYSSAFNGNNVSYSGLVKNMTWLTTLPVGAPSNYSNNTLMYEYNYDDLYQLTDAQFGTLSVVSGNNASFTSLPEYKLDNLSYDKNGNIQSLRRYAAPINSTTAHLLDNLTYSYNSTLKNRLVKVTDALSNSGYAPEFDLPDQIVTGDNYIYNQIGELIENKQENQGFEYNASGLTTRVYNTSNNYNIATFTYNDKGLRHSKTSYNTSGVAVKATYYSYDGGGAQLATYTKDLITNGATTQLQDFTLYGAGRLGVYDDVNQKAMYELTDHLGNTRAVVTKNTTSGLAETVSYTDYYPHGGVMPGRTYQNTLGVPYAYQGQEKDAETGLLNFELRQYDARLGRWYNPDPMGQHHSPYLAMSNNPISSVDFDGGWDDEVSRDSYNNGQYSYYQYMAAKHNSDGYSHSEFDNNYNHGGPLGGNINPDGSFTSNETMISGAHDIWRKNHNNDFFSVVIGITKESKDVISFSDAMIVGYRSDAIYQDIKEKGTFIDGVKDGVKNVINGLKPSNILKSLTAKKDVNEIIENALDDATMGFISSIREGVKLVNYAKNDNLAYGLGVLTGEKGTELAITVATVKAGSVIGKVGSVIKTGLGPGKQWLRIGSSYSHSMGVKTTKSIRWGASPANGGKYVNQIGSLSLRTFNQYLRSKKLPGNNWRVKDPGHFHIKL